MPYMPVLPRPPKLPLPVTQMLFASVMFAAMGVFVKIARRLPTWEVVFFRSFINFLWLMPWVLRHRETGWRKEWRALLFRGLSGTTAVLLYFYAIENMKLADAVMLSNFAPIPALMLSTIFLNERLGARSIGFVAIAFLGVGFILKPGFQVHTMAERLAGLSGLLSAFAAAAAYVSIKFATRSVSPSYIVFSFTAVASLVTLVPTVAFFVMPTPLEWLALLGAGLFATIAQDAMTRSYAGLPVSVASPLGMTTVVFSAGFGWVLWEEVPDSLAFVGSLLVLAGLLGAYRYRERHGTGV